MNRFINANGIYVNVNSIKTYWQDQNRTLHIEVGDDDIYTVPPTKANGVLEELSGEKHIVRLVPVNEPMYAVYRDDDTSVFLLIRFTIWPCAMTEVSMLLSVATAGLKPSIQPATLKVCTTRTNWSGFLVLRLKTERSPYNERTPYQHLSAAGYRGYRFER